MLVDLGVGYEHLRRRLNRAALACSFCGRSGLDAVHLIAGPKLYICERCIDDASRLDTIDAPGWTRASLSIAVEDQNATCSFCGKRRADGTRIISGAGARICTECLTLCREIEADERATLNLDRA